MTTKCLAWGTPATKWHGHISKLLQRVPCLALLLLHLCSGVCWCGLESPNTGGKEPSMLGLTLWCFVLPSKVFFLNKLVKENWLVLESAKRGSRRPKFLGNDFWQLGGNICFYLQWSWLFFFLRIRKGGSFYEDVERSCLLMGKKRDEINIKADWEQERTNSSSTLLQGEATQERNHREWQGDWLQLCSAHNPFAHLGT